MGYLGLRFRVLGLKIILCLGSDVLLELQEPDFMFLTKEPGSTLGGPNFFKKECLSKFFVAKMKKTLVVMPQKLLHSLCIGWQKSRKLRSSLLSTLHATFSKSLQDWQNRESFLQRLWTLVPGHFSSHSALSSYGLFAPLTLWRLSVSL